MPTRAEINELYSAANSLKLAEAEIKELRAELAKKNIVPAQKPLANEEILRLADYNTTYQIESPSNAGMIEFARAIETAHGIKEQL